MSYQSNINLINQSQVENTQTKPNPYTPCYNTEIMGNCKYSTYLSRDVFLNHLKLHSTNLHLNYINLHIKDSISQDAVLLGEERVSLTEIGARLHSQVLAFDRHKKLLKSILSSSVKQPFQLTLWYKSKIIEHYKKIDGKINVNIDKSLLYKQLKELLAKYNILPKEARIKIIANQIYIIDEVDGRGIDIEKIAENIVHKLKNWDGNCIEIDLVPYVYKSDITKERIEGLYNIGSYSTKLYDTNNTIQSNRYSNISNALSKINGIVIRPNQTISINEILSPYTPSNGYTSSKVFTKNDIVDGIGGGVCQVTSTLYNALLLSELHIVERHPHTFMVNYVEANRDAAVNAYSKDLIFRNNTDEILYIHGCVVNNELKISLYGIGRVEEVSYLLEKVIEKEKKEQQNKDLLTSYRRIEYETVIEEYYTPNIIKYKVENKDARENSNINDKRIYKEGRYGCRAFFYKLVYINNLLVERIYLYEDTYYELDELLVVGDLDR